MRPMVKRYVGCMYVLRVFQVSISTFFIASGVEACKFSLLSHSSKQTLTKWNAFPVKILISLAVDH